MIAISNVEGTRSLLIQVQGYDSVLISEIANEIVTIGNEWVLDHMGVEGIHIMKYASPPIEVSNIKRNVILAGAMGLGIPCIFLSFMYLLNNKIRTAEEAEWYLQVSNLGSIPKNKELAGKDRKRRA